MRRAEASIVILKGVGGVIFAVGVLLFCGNVFRFLVTFPFAGYITMAIGGALFRYGQQQSSQRP